ncbi:MAG: T9SS type A sorting domain-containing protein [Bacteroidia bacterium]
MKTITSKGLWAFVASILAVFPANAQTNEVHFGGSTNGTSVSISYNRASGVSGTPSNTDVKEGDVVLYENVAYVSGAYIDCYVEITDITNTSSITLDNASASGSGFSGSQPEFFAPNINFSSAGSLTFEFQFITDGSFSFNSSTGVASGTNYELDSVRIVTYDLDGNGGSNSNQYNDFSGFSTSSRSATTNVSATTTAGVTRFESTVTSNSSVVTHPDHKVEVTYDSLTNWEITVGAGASGLAYFYLDFAAGTTGGQTDYEIMGYVFDDADGLEDNTVDGTGIDDPSSTQLYASLIDDATDEVVESVAVMADGSYEFAVVPDNKNYQVIITTTQLTVGSTGNSSDLPSGWVNTGENEGAGSGNDGNANGSIDVTLNGSNISNLNFGIDAIPTANTYNENMTGTPHIDSIYTIGDPTWFGLTANTPDGDDLEDGAIAPDVLYITSIPSDSNSLYYNGVKITLGDDNTNPPSDSNPFTINSFDPDKLEFNLMDKSDLTFSFDYQVEDAATVKSESATFSFNYPTPVPVDFISINATLVADGQVMIEWVTASEIDNERFEIERSVDGDYFEMIGETPGAGNSQEILNYSYMDVEAPLLSSALYYRIKQVDYSGQYDYSDIAEVVRKESTDLINVYPNPASDYINIQSNLIAGELTIEISDISGMLVRNMKINGDTQISTEGLDRGVYFVTVSNDRESQTIKVLID